MTSNEGDKVMTATPSSPEVTSTVDDTTLSSASNHSEGQKEEPQDVLQPRTPPRASPPSESPTRINITMQRPRSEIDIELTLPTISVANQRHAIEINVLIEVEIEEDDEHDVASA